MRGYISITANCLLLVSSLRCEFLEAHLRTLFFTARVTRFAGPALLSVGMDEFRRSPGGAPLDAICWAIGSRSPPSNPSQSAKSIGRSPDIVAGSTYKWTSADVGVSLSSRPMTGTLTSSSSSARMDGSMRSLMRVLFPEPGYLCQLFVFGYGRYEQVEVGTIPVGPMNETSPG